VIKGGVTLLAVVFVMTGCGSSGSHASGGSQSDYTLRQVKAAFLAQGFTLQSVARRPGVVVLADLRRSGAFGYQHTGYTQDAGTQFLVFVGDGRHSAEQRNVWVGYGGDEVQSVKAALHGLMVGSAR
jgi:hypothetical protein